MTKVNKVPFSFDVKKTKEKLYFYVTKKETTTKKNFAFEEQQKRQQRYLVTKVIINLLVFLKSDKENSLSFIMTFWKEKFQSTLQY